MRLQRSKIHAFEPVPSLFSLLEQPSRLAAERLSCYNMALAGSIGTKILNVSGGTSDGSSSLLLPKHRPPLTCHFAAVKAVVVVVVDLNYLLLPLRRWMIGSLKIRSTKSIFSGSICTALNSEKCSKQSSPNCLASVRAIYTEVSLLQMYEGTPLYPDYRRWLEARGFRVELEDLPWRDMGNVLFGCGDEVFVRYRQHYGYCEAERLCVANVSDLAWPFSIKHSCRSEAQATEPCVDTLQAA